MIELRNPLRCNYPLVPWFYYMELHNFDGLTSLYSANDHLNFGNSEEPDIQKAASEMLINAILFQHTFGNGLWK